MCSPSARPKRGSTGRPTKALAVDWTGAPPKPGPEIVEVGQPGVESVGPDLAGFFVGSEGLFGVALEITLRLLPRPAFFATFDQLAASPLIFSGLRLGISAGFIGAILSELKITPTGVGDIITFSRSIADYPSMYAAIFSIIVLAVLFLNLLERTEKHLFKGNDRGYVSD